MYDAVITCRRTIKNKLDFFEIVKGCGCTLDHFEYIPNERDNPTAHIILRAPLALEVVASHNAAYRTVGLKVPIVEPWEISIFHAGILYLETQHGKFYTPDMLHNASGGWNVDWDSMERIAPHIFEFKRAIVNYFVEGTWRDAYIWRRKPGFLSRKHEEILIQEYNSSDLREKLKQDALEKTVYT